MRIGAGRAIGSADSGEGEVSQPLTGLSVHFSSELSMKLLGQGLHWDEISVGEQFKTLLIRTYSSALNQYRDQTIETKPLRADPNATDVIVRTEVIRPGQPPVQIDYSMTKTPSGWKAYDVIVGGVSLVTNYRDEFTQQVQAGGIDGLIRSLQAKNGGGAAK